MTQENTQRSEWPATKIDGAQMKDSTVTATDVSWSVDVSAPVEVDSDTVVTAAKKSSALKKLNGESSTAAPRRGLSRLSPKKDSRAVKRREKLRKLRRKLKNASPNAVPDAKSKPAGTAEVVRSAPECSEDTQSQQHLEPPVAKAAELDEQSQATEQVVRSKVVAEIASLVSQNLKTSTDQPTEERKVETEPKDREFREENSSKGRMSKPVVVASAFALADPVPVEQERYRDWLRRVVLKSKWMSVFTTFYVHWLILLALGAIIVHGPENAANLLINATFAAESSVESPSFEVVVPEPQPIQEDVESRPKPAATQPATIEESDLALDQSVLETIAPNPSDSSAEAKESEETESDSKARTTPTTNPAPTRAISKGSFSVWTEPTCPEAGEPYRIIIQVCVPNGLKRYNVADLQGVVVGSDGYRKPIPGFLRGFLPVEDGYARLIIPIVSADERVQDTVFIRSRVLKETQKLLIEFESAL